MDRISVSMALASLEEASQVVKDLEAELARARDERNALIVDAIHSGIPQVKVVKASGVSREYIVRIAGGSPYRKNEAKA